MVPRSSAIAQVMGVTNAVTIDADAVKELTLIGPGAGGDATASAVVADIADVVLGKAFHPFGCSVDRLEKAVRAPMQRHEGGYYIRLTVHDRPGVAAGVACGWPRPISRSRAFCRNDPRKLLIRIRTAGRERRFRLS